MSESLLLKNGFVFDPKNNVIGERMDIAIKNGVIVESVNEKDAEVIDVGGKMVFPGGIDIHTHVASQHVNFGRMLYPSSSDSVLFTAPEVGLIYSKMGYTFVVEAAVSPTKALHTHLEFQDIQLLDYACLLLLDTYWYLLPAVKKKSVEEAAIIISWLLGSTKTYGVKLVNPLASDAWSFKKEITSIEEPIRHLGVSPLEVIQTLTKANEHLGLPHPIHIHPNHAGKPGNYETTLKTLKALEEIKPNKKQRTIHLAHAQLHSYGGSETIESKAEQIANYINTHQNVEADIGQMVSHQTISLYADNPLLTRTANEKNIFTDQVEMEASFGAAPTKHEMDKTGSITWATGLELALQIKDPWQIQLSVDHPNQALITDYPQIIAWLVSKKVRDQVKLKADTALPSIEREYSLNEIVIITRASPAQSLNLPNKGNLSIGSDADIAVYNFNPETQDPTKETEDLIKAFSQTSYTIKNGVIVMKEGESIEKFRGKTYWAHRDGVELPEKRMTEMERYYSLDINNLKIPKEILHNPNEIKY
ncbi:MAG: formylmethanofuran dehydrogenase subunit A [Candidatus Jordarchaeum sp.]|uniref:formylmethanofuran dehydrogenase subunit A n=1 Tax=Candidatus Jordarchaeum sp. TaxID=2823881 RepID=UPI0040494240